MLAVREMLDEAYRVAPDFQRAVLLTGDTLPLLPPDRLEVALLDEVREYIQLIEVPNDPTLRGLRMQEAQTRGSLLEWRFQNFTYLDDEMVSPRSRAEFIRRYGVDENTANYLRGEAEKITLKLTSQLLPRAPIFSRFYYGESWWGLTRSSVDLIIDDLHAQVSVEFFQLLQVPDEHFVQTVLGNKRRALQSANRQIVGSPIFVDHLDPVRSSFGRDALSAARFRDAALSGRHLFARKYDPELMPDVAAAVASGCFFSDIVGS